MKKNSWKAFADADFELFFLKVTQSDVLESKWAKQFAMSMNSFKKLLTPNSNRKEVIRKKIQSENEQMLWQKRRPKLYRERREQHYCLLFLLLFNPFVKEKWENSDNVSDDRNHRNLYFAEEQKLLYFSIPFYL